MPPPSAAVSPVLLAFGFRPFFLVAGIYAGVAIPVWYAIWHGALPAPGPLPASQWHGHEMVFGFAAAAVAGFMLTAVPNWTGSPPVAGARLAALVALWLAGRIAMGLATMLPPLAVAAADLAFLPAVAVAAGRPIVATGQRRNVVFPLLVGVLVVANGLVHLEAAGFAADAAGVGLSLAIYVLAIMIAAIGGRIVPAFTANALGARGRAAGVRSIPVLERVALAALVAAAAADLATPGGTAAGVLAAAASVLLAARMARWGSLRTLDQPILWVLHLGSVWLPAAMALRAAADLGGWIAPELALHALTTGAIGTMVLAVATRVALGHTGRPLIAAPVTVAAYVLVTMAALARVAGPILAPGAHDSWLATAATAWSLAYALFVVGYWRILTRPRVDGRPG